MEHSLSSAFESRLSVQSSTSSSLSGWAPRARSASVSSQSSNDSVNLDALIAEGSDINEECPLELEEVDDVEWSRVQQQQQQQALLQPARSRSTTAGSEANMLQYDDHDVDQYWEGSDMIATEDDEEFDEALREFSQLAIKSSSIEVRGLAGQRRTEPGSKRFADGRNHFDLDGDYMDRPSGLRPVSNRTSTHSNYSSTSDNNTGSKLQAPGASRGQGSTVASGLRAPASRLAQPKSMLAQPKTATSSTASPRTGINRPSGVQPPRTGSQAPKSGLQPPRAASVLGRASSLAKPTTTGVARAGVASNGVRSTAAAGSRVPSKPTQGLARPSASKTQAATPGSIRRSPAAPVTTSNRNSLLPAPSSMSSSKSGMASNNGRTTPNSRTMTNPKRSLTQPSLLTSPTRLPSTRQASSSHLVSPTSSQSSTSSLPSLAHGSKDAVTPLSRRLSNATGTTRHRTAAATGRSISMYGASSLLQHQDDYEYSVLTPPQSPSSKIAIPAINMDEGKGLDPTVDSDSKANVPVVDELKQAQTQKIRTENRERKKRWREANEDRNKDNDLRCRVNKRANKLFGKPESDHKTRWIEEEFKKRQTKRREKELKKNPNATFKDPQPAIVSKPSVSLGDQQTSHIASVKPIEAHFQLLQATASALNPNMPQFDATTVKTALALNDLVKKNGNHLDLAQLTGVLTDPNLARQLMELEASSTATAAQTAASLMVLNTPPQLAPEPQQETNKGNHSMDPEYPMDAVLTLMQLNGSWKA
ncbi:hypothetical protein KVV02_005699 [Mortierella alpina]|uniref:DUF3020 domain-containing protein n=1 Tax=Mortierella alpina TaxID=64518 RepID=A0A9P8CVV7_MORAP|nr:hypothetical protein KVV02_005699 [Mortierella alpina]